MKKPTKGKLPKKPILKKYSKGPKAPKGGIKTEAQLKAYEAKKAEWNKAKKAVDAENSKKLNVWKAAVKKVEDAYKSELKKFDTFRTRVEKAKKTA